MITSKKYQGELTTANITTSVLDSILVEKPLQISINDQVFTVTMTTPNKAIDLAIGLLYAEDIIKSFDLISRIEHDNGDDLDKINIHIDQKNLKEGYMSSRNFLSLSSCGICGKTELPDLNGFIEGEILLDSLSILNGFNAMRKQQELFNETGGCHAAGILDKSGEPIIVAEDIGRHNAVDKTIGHLLRNNLLNEGKCMLVSGRISYEIVIKCFRGKIKQLVAVSAPSSLAIDYSKELGIALYGFCRQNKLTRYA